jgi:hypothetical protein
MEIDCWTIDKDDDTGINSTSLKIIDFLSTSAGISCSASSSCELFEELKTLLDNIVIFPFQFQPCWTLFFYHFPIFDL